MSKTNILKIVFIAASVVILGIFIACNVVFSTFSTIIHTAFAGDNTDYGSASTELQEGDELVQSLAEDSMVLLKNEGFLPLKDEEVKVNLFGWAATDQGFLLVGGGSGGTVIAQQSKVTLTQAFDKEGVKYNKDLLDKYSALSDWDADQNSNSPDSIKALTNPDKSFYTDELMQSAKSYSNTAVVVISRFSGENASQQELIDVGSYKNGTFLELTANEKAMFDALQENNFDVVVLINCTNNPELGFLEDYSCVKAAINVGLPGQSGTLAIPRILTGKVNPSGRTADTYAYDYQTYNPSYINGRYDSNNSMTYQEGIYVGYKWYETADVEGYFDNVSNQYGSGYDAVVQYPFGYGLSYTDFEWEVTSVSWKSSDTMAKGVEYTIEVVVHNTGSEAGKDVVQLYTTAPYTEGGVEVAAVSLVDFAKTEEIPAGGKSEPVTLSFTAYDVASYDDYNANGDADGFCGYKTLTGDYEFRLMRNAHEDGIMKTGSDSSYSLYSEGLRFETDPVTNATVENRFTGEDAYADMPVDGSKNIAGGVDYLSRANDFANYPTSAAPSATNVNGTYRYDGYDDKDVSNIKYGEDAGQYLVLVDEGTDEEGNQLTSRPTAEMLEGTEEAKLIINEELMKTLSDYGNDEAWTTFLNQMTKDEVKDLIGRGGFRTSSVYSVGKPKCTDRDGPAGFNMGVTNPNTETKWTGFPTESLIGCSWNKSLAYQMGVAQGKVASATGLQGWYAPGVNLHRSVYNTRNYEYFSEDTILTADLGAAIVKGAKENNLYCYVKHFAVSEAGANPNDKSTWLTDQALREIYLKPFEICVKEGGANAMMSAFNRVGGVWAGSNHALLTDVLRGEWGFKGSVITDWYQASYMDYERGLLAGNSLWLDGSFDRAAIIDLDDNGVAYAARQAVKDILYTYIVTTTAVAVTATPFSPVFVFLWVLIDVVLVAGLGVCVFFAVRQFLKKDSGAALADGVSSDASKDSEEKKSEDTENKE